MTGFKFPLLICLLIFHATNKTAAEIKEEQLERIVKQIKEVQDATLRTALGEYREETNRLMSRYTENLKSISHKKCKVTDQNKKYPMLK